MLYVFVRVYGASGTKHLLPLEGRSKLFIERVLHISISACPIDVVTDWRLLQLDYQARMHGCIRVA